jgi:hypothetical protein
MQVGSEMARLILFVLFSFLSVSVWAQPTLHFQRGPRVRRGIDTLVNPWGGGINSGQFSHVDLNNDGILDLVVFDRADRSLTPYLAEARNGAYEYIYAPEYRASFPGTDSLGAWVLFRDYDCDGLIDLFTERISNIRAFRNTSAKTGNKLSFQLTYDRIYSTYSGFRTFLYAANIDISGIVDVDSDGDTDFLVYDVNGTQVEWHRNYAKELYNRCDTFVFQLVSPCFGHFLEYYDLNTNSFTVFLNRPPCPAEFKTNQTNHVGGTILPLQLNGDSLYDMLLADVGVPYMISVTNGGTRAKANFSSADTVFPSYDTRVNLKYFPAAYQIDVDQDGSRDLVVAPNQEQAAEDYRCVWYYNNKGADDYPNFNFKNDTFLVSTQIDRGTGAAPCLFDENGDGKLDLLVGNRSMFINDTRSLQSIVLYRNIGTNRAPEYQWVTDDYLNIATTTGMSNFKNLIPTAGDVDNDGKIDLLIGEDSGGLIYYRNSASPTQPANFSLISTNYLGIKSMGFRRLAPVIQDVNADGRNDLVIGYNRGQLLLYLDTMKTGASSFQLKTKFWGKVTTLDGRLDNYNGNSKPFFLDYDNDRTTDLLVGALNGQVYVYKGLSADTSIKFARFDSLFKSPNGRDVKPTAYRLPNADSLMYFFGTYRGGVQVALQPIPPDQTTGSDPELRIDLALKVYPNPAQTNVIFNAPAAGTLSVLDMQGRLLSSQKAVGGPQGFDVDNLATGLYLLRWEGESGLSLTTRLQILPR